MNILYFFSSSDYDTETCSRCIEAEKELDKVESPELFEQGQSPVTGSI